MRVARAVAALPPKRVLGIDLSGAQGASPDIAGAAREGVRFVIQKISQGEHIVDRSLVRNTNEAAKVVRFLGGYGWPEPQQDPIRQAALAADLYGEHVLGKAAVPLPFMVDVEDDDHARPGGPIRGARLATVLEAYVAEIERRTGRLVWIYTGKWFWDLAFANVKTFLTERPLVHAQYPRPRCPGGKNSQAYTDTIRNLPPFTAPAAFAHVIAQQFDGDGGLYLPDGTDCDFDVFFGDELDLETAANLAKIETAKTDPAPGPIDVSGPPPIRAGEGQQSIGDDEESECMETEGDR